jgi:hypothetical protein
MKLTPEEQALVDEANALATRAGALGSEPRFQVTRRLLEAAAWRITYSGQKESQA